MFHFGHKSVDVSLCEGVMTVATPDNDILGKKLKHMKAKLKKYFINHLFLFAFLHLMFLYFFNTYIYFFQYQLKFATC